MTRVPKPTPHRWQFRTRFRRGGFGWKSQPAVQRVREAVREIQRVAKKDPVLAGEGAVLFLERVVPAIESVDGSSGSIGAAMNNAVRDLVAILAAAPADAPQREEWLERLFAAFEEDGMPYIDDLGAAWGTLCVEPEIASRWADRFIDQTRHHFRERRGYMKEAVLCLSALHAAERYEEVADLLQDEDFWPYRRWLVKALASQGRTEEALALVDGIRDWSRGYDAIRLGEEILIAAGRVDEAYRRYGLRAGGGETNLAYFRAVAKKYPHKRPEEVLADLVARTSGEAGRWFAAAKSLGLSTARRSDSCSARPVIPRR